MTDNPNAPAIERILAKRAHSEQHGTTAIYYEEDIDVLLDELKIATQAIVGDAAKAHIQNHDVYRTALAALIRKSKRTDANGRQVLRIFPKDIKSLHGKNAAVRWEFDGEALMLTYEEGPEMVQ